MAHHRKKVAGHKLDYDCKKRHGEQGTGMVDSERKFAESYKVVFIPQLISQLITNLSRPHS